MKGIFVGFSILTTPTLTKACRMLSENKTWKVFGVEVLGINLPKTALVRTQDEAIDVGVNEFGNTLGFFGGLWGGGKLIDTYLKSRGLKILANSNVISQARVIKSFALIPPLVGFMAAMPFFRNAFTAWRSGTVDYKDLITKGRKPNTPQNRQKTQAAIQDFLVKGAAIMGGSLALAALGVFAAASRGPLKMFKNPTTLVPGLKKFASALKAVCLTGDKATEFGDLRAIAYWGLPAYLGWMAASRDGFEIKEQFLKMLNFVGVYVLTEKVVDQFFKAKSTAFAKISKAKNWGLYSGTLAEPTFVYKALSQFKGKLPVQAHKMLWFENLRLVSGFGLTVALMATLPALLNIHLTNRRIARAETEQRQKAQVQAAYAAAWQNRMRNMQLANPSVSR